MARVRIEDQHEAFLRQEGPAVLARYDEAWFRARRRHGLEHFVCGVVPLVGLLLCGWPAQPMAVFMLFALLAGLAADAVKLAVAPDLVHRACAGQAHDAELWGIADALRAGQAEMHATDQQPPLSLTGQLGMAAFFAVSLCGSVIWSVREHTGIALLERALDRPDMLLGMGVMLLAQLAMTAVDTRRALHEEPIAGELRFEPMLEAILYFIILFLWMVIGGIVLKLGALDGSASDEALVATLVVIGNAVLVWRGIGEIRDAHNRLQAAEWLRMALASGAHALRPVDPAAAGRMSAPK